MACSVQQGKAIAAAEALSVSELELQRIKQEGCRPFGACSREKMRLPNLRAYAYPANSNAPQEVSLEDRANAGEDVNSQGFARPFVSEVAGGNAEKTGQYGVPGLDFAGSGDLQALNDVTFQASPSSSSYESIANRIRGNSDNDKSSVRRKEEEEDSTLFPLGSAGLVQKNIVEDGKNIQRCLYGQSLDAAQRCSKSNNKAEEENSFQEQRQQHQQSDKKDTISSSRTSQAVRGALYDFLHFQDATKHLYGATNWGKSFDICTRSNRGPYILLVVVAVVLFLLLLFQSLRYLLSTPSSSSRPPPLLAMPGMQGMQGMPANCAAAVVPIYWNR